jgi:hypothetical protein
MIRCNMCMKIFNNDEFLPICVDCSGKYVEFFKGCSHCKTDQYLMDMENDS